MMCGRSFQKKPGPGALFCSGANTPPSKPLGPLPRHVSSVRLTLLAPVPGQVLRRHVLGLKAEGFRRVLGFRVKGLGYIGFRVSGLGFRV